MSSFQICGLWEYLAKFANLLATAFPLLFNMYKRKGGKIQAKALASNNNWCIIKVILIMSPVEIDIFPITIYYINNYKRISLPIITFTFKFII